MALALLLVSCATPPPQEPQPTEVADLPPLAGQRVVIMKPDIDLFVIQAGGLPEVQANWTRFARDTVPQVLSDRLAAKRLDVLLAEEIDRDRPLAPVERQVLSLHTVVADAIRIQKNALFDALPTKQAGFDWSLGAEAQALADRYEADYAIFVKLHENYPGETLAGTRNLGSVSRLSNLMSLYREGYLSLVDLRSGRVVWFAERDRESPGLRNRLDLRETVAAMLKNFPG